MRQRYFIMKCMADFKRRNMTWTLLIDVDEYVTFNQIQANDPGVPLDMPPEGIPIISDWKPVYGLVESENRFYDHNICCSCVTTALTTRNA